MTFRIRAAQIYMYYKLQSIQVGLTVFEYSDYRTAKVFKRNRCSFTIQRRVHVVKAKSWQTWLVDLDQILLLFVVMFCRFYRAMHFSAKRGIAIASRLSVRLWRWWIVIT